MVAPGTPEGSIVSSASQHKHPVASSPDINTTRTPTTGSPIVSSASQHKDSVASSPDINPALTPTIGSPIVSRVPQRKDLIASSEDVNATLTPLGCDAAALVDPSHHEGKELRADGELKLSLDFDNGTPGENVEKVLADAVSIVLVRTFISDIVDVDSIETVARRLAATKFALRFATSPSKRRHEVSSELTTNIAMDLQKQLPGIALVTVTSMSIQWCGHSLNYNLRGKPAPATQAFPIVFIVVGVVVGAVAVAIAIVCVFRKRGASAGVNVNVVEDSDQKNVEQVAPSDDPTIIGGKAVENVSAAI